jgi:hypothetical protein
VQLDWLGGCVKPCQTLYPCARTKPLWVHNGK